MEKQKKVLSKINKQTGTYDNLLSAKLNPNDEFYTSQQDISNELSHWANKFEGKRIICPCDWDIFKDEDIYSLTVEFDPERQMDITSATWYRNKIKKITYLKYIQGDSIIRKNGLFINKNNSEEVVIEGERANSYLRDENRVKCNFIRCLIDLGTQYSIKSITASGYNPSLDKGIKFQDVDYSLYDICATNPPFSMCKEFITYMVDERNRRLNTSNPFNFIVMSSLVNRANPCIGLNLMLRNCYLGYNRGKSISFLNPDKIGSLKSKNVAVDWVTSFTDAQDELNKGKMTTGIDYNLYKNDYPIMDRMTMKDDMSHPIHVKSIQAIPDNYYGWMFGPVNILDRLSYNEFDWYLTNAKGYYNTSHKEMNPFAHKASDTMVSTDNESNFHGIVFRRRKD